MARLLILIVIVALVAWLYMKLQRQVRHDPRRAPPPDRSTQTVRCETCGLYLPTADAYRSGPRHYCDKHRPPP